MRRFKSGQLHSGENGKVVTNPKQAKAIALSACGQSKYSEVLQSLGYSVDASDEIVSMFAEVDWQKQFETGKEGPEKKENYETGQVYSKGFLSRMAKTGVKADGGKLKVNNEAGMISGSSLPKGPANPMGGSSKDVQGMRQLG
jgi:hypothetical protein